MGPETGLHRPRPQRALGTPGVEGAERKPQGSGTKWSQELQPPQLTLSQENCKGPRAEAGLESVPCPGASVGCQNQSHFLDGQDSGSWVCDLG